MAPQRFRGIQEDSRSESSSTRDKQLGQTSSGISKNRRHQGSNQTVGSNLKDVIVAASSSTTFQQNGQDGLNTADKVPWTAFDITTLNAYRQAHYLNIPAAFASAYNQYILTRPGIGMSSPTMALHKDRRRASKDHLALAVRKDFNSAMTSEPETITNFLYTVQNQGKLFRTRFGPLRPK